MRYSEGGGPAHCEAATRAARGMWENICPYMWLCEVDTLRGVWRNNITVMEWNLCTASAKSHGHRALSLCMRQHAAAASHTGRWTHHVDS